jgi:hypothetical protein
VGDLRSGNGVVRTVYVRVRRRSGTLSVPKKLEVSFMYNPEAKRRGHLLNCYIFWLCSWYNSFS